MIKVDVISVWWSMIKMIAVISWRISVASQVTRPKILMQLDSARSRSPSCLKTTWVPCRWQFADFQSVLKKRILRQTSASDRFIILHCLISAFRTMGTYEPWATKSLENSSSCNSSVLVYIDLSFCILLLAFGILWQKEVQEQQLHFPFTSIYNHFHLLYFHSLHLTVSWSLLVTIACLFVQLWNVLLQGFWQLIRLAGHHQKMTSPLLLSFGPFCCDVYCWRLSVCGARITNNSFRRGVWTILVPNGTYS